jgi:hypothetical protein
LKNRDQEEQRQQPNSAAEQERQLEALFGPAARYSEHQRGETITFASRDTGGQPLSGKILYVRAPAPAIRDGKTHPVVYITFVKGEAFPRMVYPGDVLTEHKNSSS